jgi:hypothetical protein
MDELGELGLGDRLVEHFEDLRHVASRAASDVVCRARRVGRLPQNVTARRSPERTAGAAGADRPEGPLAAKSGTTCGLNFISSPSKSKLVCQCTHSIAYSAPLTRPDPTRPALVGPQRH